jgi:hypothetical protein
MGDNRLVLNREEWSIEGKVITDFVNEHAMGNLTSSGTVRFLRRSLIGGISCD